VAGEVILVVLLGRIESHERHHLRHDRPAEHVISPRGVYVAECRPPLRVAGVEHHRARFDHFAKEGHWDYAALSAQSVKVDPETGLVDIVQRMQAADEHFDYDVSTYTSAPRHARPFGPYPYPYSYFSPYSYYGPGWWDYGFGGLGFWWGRTY
jgi:hypothetical protein